MYQKILFTEPGVARLCEYTLEAPQKNEVQVKLMISYHRLATERSFPMIQFDWRMLP